ncbi:hypothetical protein [Lysinibacter sp. HNR]|uniref:hypothetical protein n=1 Tax=Lysinibacter sp. HNR TaxID=3031408 RepID=UPI0024358CC7|nr:hypothetical protein [Lysinibacter sp. HNR]WGD37219.1 hypothetical protein FrondiHNR_12420 [Lysinibacter sp. HNR]
MAGRALSIDMGDDDLIPVWRTVIELAEANISSEWTLVGGLMVAVHARRTGVVMRRPTDDVDVLVDYMTNRMSLVQARVALDRIGFDLSDNERHAYRFQHEDGRKVDLMVADHLPSRMEPRLGRRPAFPIPSGEQAIRRRDLCTLRFDSGSCVVVGVPDERGALVAKGAAWMVDRRDRNRHLDDSAVLLACVTDASALGYESMSKNDRKRIRAVIDQLVDPAHLSWINLDEVDRERGMFTLSLIRQALGFTD